MEIRVVSFVLVPMVLAGALGGTATAVDAEPSAGVEFARDIQPIFEANCYRCRSSEKRKNGLRLDVQAEAMRGGDSGPVISPGDAEGSLLYQYVSGADPDIIMPPKGDPLTTDAATTPSRQGSPQLRGVHGARYCESGPGCHGLAGRAASGWDATCTARSGATKSAPRVLENLVRERRYGSRSCAPA